MKVVITCRQMARDVDLLRPAFEHLDIEVFCVPVVQALAGNELATALAGAVGVLAGDDHFTSDVMDRCPELRVISKWGVGVDGIDQIAAAERGIQVLNTPGAFDDEVADVTIAYLVLLARQLHAIDREVRAGGWPKPAGTSLSTRTLGIVGLGGIGRAVAKRASAMGMTVLGTDPLRDNRREAQRLGVEPVSMDDLVERSDALTFHCPLTTDTIHMMDRDQFARMREGCYLINTARGALIHEAALIEALANGTVAAAALDVLEQEPLAHDNPLRRFEQVIFGSHNASNTLEAGIRTHWRALRNLVEALGMEMP